LKQVLERRETERNLRIHKVATKNAFIFGSLMHFILFGALPESIAEQGGKKGHFFNNDTYKNILESDYFDVIENEASDHSIAQILRFVDPKS